MNSFGIGFIGASEATCLGQLTEQGQAPAPRRDYATQSTRDEQVNPNDEACRPSNVTTHDFVRHRA